MLTNNLQQLFPNPPDFDLIELGLWVLIIVLLLK